MKQESRASIRTVIASSPPGPSLSDNKVEPDLGTSVETNKPPPPPDADVLVPSIGSLGLELGEFDVVEKRDQSLDKGLQGQLDLHPKLEPSPLEPEDAAEDSDSVNEYANVQLSETARAAVRASEERFRQIGWAAVREELEYYAEKACLTRGF